MKRFIARTVWVAVVAVGVWAQQVRADQQIYDTATAGTTWQVPAGVTSVTVKSWGGGGGAGGSNGTNTAGDGGGGGYATETISVTPLENLTIRVGGGGGGGSGADGAGGGGYSAVLRGSTFLIQSGGGGGGGGADTGSSEIGGDGGAGGGASGVAGQDGQGGTQSVGGGPGTQAGGGAGGSGGDPAGHDGTSGAANQGGQGGNGYDPGSGAGAAGGTNGGGSGGSEGPGGRTGAGGGGAGFYGGGGGEGSDGEGAAAGGGGASYNASSCVSGCTAGSGRTAGNNGDADYGAASAGQGALGDTNSGVAGNPGRVVLNYTPPPVISVSGVCKAYDQSANCADLGTIRVAVNGTLDTVNMDTGGGNGGTWTIANVIATTGDIITVYVDNGAGAASDEAVAVTKYDGTTNITGMLLYKEHLTLGSDDNQTLTHANLLSYDYSASGNNENVFYNAEAANLAVDELSQSTQERLLIKAGNTYQAPTGLVVTANLQVDGTYTGNTETLTLNGSGTPMVVSGTFTANSNTVNYVSTSATTVAGVTYNKLGVGTTSDTGTGVTYTLGGVVVTVNDQLTVGNASSTFTDTLDGADKILYFYGDGTGASRPFLVTSKGSFTPSAGNVWYRGPVAGGGDLEIETTNTTYYDLYTNRGSTGTATWTVNGPLTVGDTWSIQQAVGNPNTLNLNLGGTTVVTGSIMLAGTGIINLSTTGSNHALTAASLALSSGNKTFNANGSVVTLTGSGTPFDVTSGVFNPGASTIVYTGTSPTTITATTYNHLSLIPAATVTYTLGSTTSTIHTTGNFICGNGADALTCDLDTPDATLDVDENFTVAAGATFMPDEGTARLQVGGNYTNSGTMAWDGGEAMAFDATTAGHTLNGTMTGGSAFQIVTFNGVNGGWTLAADAAVATALNITNGTLNQGASYNLTTNTVTVGPGGVWTNTGTGDVTLSGDVANTGAITLNSNNGSQCVDGADDIVVDSTVNNTTRAWSGAGAFTLYNLNVDDMTGTVTAYTSTLSGDTTWTQGSCGGPVVPATIRGGTQIRGGTSIGQ